MLSALSSYGAVVAAAVLVVCHHRGRWLRNALCAGSGTCHDDLGGARPSSMRVAGVNVEKGSVVGMIRLGMTVVLAQGVVRGQRNLPRRFGRRTYLQDVVAGSNVEKGSVVRIAWLHHPRFRCPRCDAVGEQEQQGEDQNHFRHCRSIGLEFGLYAGRSFRSRSCRLALELFLFGARKSEPHRRLCDFLCSSSSTMRTQRHDSERGRDPHLFKDPRSQNAKMLR